MIVDLPLLISAMAAMFVAAFAVDLVRPRVIREAGVQRLTWADHLLVNLLFFVLTPGMLYGWFYPLVPFSGYRAGLFLALAFFLLAIAPTFAVYRLQVREGTTATIGHLLWLLVKYGAVYGILTQVYQP